MEILDCTGVMHCQNEGRCTMIRELRRMACGVWRILIHRTAYFVMWV